MRHDGRQPNDLRPVHMQAGFMPNAHGSVLIACGDTRLLCTAMLSDNVPGFIKGSGRGWLTAEYAMLPGSTPTRKSRDISHGRQDGRAVEIQRLIGRSLRTALDFTLLGERTIHIDCDVIQADGGTRCAAITGGYVALALAIQQKMQEGVLEHSPLIAQVAAVSAGLDGGIALLDLDYIEDSNIDTDLNLVMGTHGLIEVQGTGEKDVYTREQLNQMLDLGEAGIARLFAHQRDALGGLIPQKEGQ